VKYHIVIYKKDENGSVLLVACLLLFLLGLIGIFAISSSRTLTTISTNNILYHKKFNVADAGLTGTTILIHNSFYPNNIFDTALYDYNGTTFIYNFNEFRDILNGFNTTSTSSNSTIPPSTTITLKLKNFNAAIEINESSTSTIPGMGSEFASAAQGVGIGSTAAVAKVFDLNATTSKSIITGSAHIKPIIFGKYREINR